MNITLNLEQYQALVTLARRGAADADAQRQLTAFLAVIEKANDFRRYSLWVQWQETGQVLPPTVVFPTKWPPELRTFLERTDRALARTDVEVALKQVAVKPVNILVTRDIGALVGWTTLDDFFKGA